MKERSNDRKANVTMLFVEDDSNDIFLITRALSKTKVAAPFFVQSLAEMQAYLHGSGQFGDRQRFPIPEIIVTDYRLCGSSAKDVIECVRSSADFRNIPIIVLSSFVPPREIDVMLDAGARACLEKPAQFSEVCAVLQRAAKFAQN